VLPEVAAPVVLTFPELLPVAPPEVFPVAPLAPCVPPGWVDPLHAGRMPTAARATAAIA
jgi:hypothetical protein